jgi:methionine synthase I (cobalamin-dependent)
MAAPSVIDKTDLLETLLAERILLLDGAMGTLVQALGFDERAMRGERFEGHHKDLKNFADILCLTHPHEVTEMHRHYLAAGADIVETNTFGASPIGAIEFELGDEVIREINLAAATCARRACDEFNENTHDKPRFVAGSIGPTAKQMTISTRVDDARPASLQSPAISKIATFVFLSWFRAHSAKAAQRLCQDRMSKHSGTPLHISPCSPWG